jgi:hypothetical protein
MSYYTGRYVTSHGATWNNIPLSVGEWTLGDYVRPLGPRVGLVGKTHMRIDRDGFSRLGLDQGSTAGRYAAECGFEPFARDDGLHPDFIYDPDASYERYLREKGYDGKNLWQDWANSGSDEDGALLSGWYMRNARGLARIPEEHSETAWTTDQAMEFIRVQGDQPWVLHVSYIKPHWPYIVSAPYHGMYGPEDCVPAIRSEAEREDAHPVFKVFMQHPESVLFAKEEVRLTVAPTYMGLIKQIDAVSCSTCHQPNPTSCGRVIRVGVRAVRGAGSLPWLVRLVVSLACLGSFCACLISVDAKAGSLNLRPLVAGKDGCVFNSSEHQNACHGLGALPCVPGIELFARTHKRFGGAWKEAEGAAEGGAFQRLLWRGSIQAYRSSSDYLNEVSWCHSVILERDFGSHLRAVCDWSESDGVYSDIGSQLTELSFACHGKLLARDFSLVLRLHGLFVGLGNGVPGGGQAVLGGLEGQEQQCERSSSSSSGVHERSGIGPSSQPLLPRPLYPAFGLVLALVCGWWSGRSLILGHAIGHAVGWLGGFMGTVLFLLGMANLYMRVLP